MGTNLRLTPTGRRRAYGVPSGRREGVGPTDPERPVGLSIDRIVTQVGGTCVIIGTVIVRKCTFNDTLRVGDGHGVGGSGGGPV